MSDDGNQSLEEAFATLRTAGVCPRCRQRKTKCDGTRRYCAYHPGNQTSSADPQPHVTPQQLGDRETFGAAQDQMESAAPAELGVDMADAQDETGTADEVNKVDDATDAEAEYIARAVASRVYLNRHVTPHLLEAMRYLGAYQPERPLEWLSEFCRRRSEQVEG